MSVAGILLVGLAIAVGLAGIILPILPGAALVIGAIAVWAFVVGTATSWVVFGVAAVLIGAATVIKYTWPVKRMRAADVRTSVLVAGGVAGIVGFFVIPVIGLLIGFVLGVFAAEMGIRRDVRRAWASTVHALKGVALSVGVELTGALLATMVWVVGVFLTV
ncbi:hypothetical protein CRI77_00055 [Mycolicibacterium duvalii]|uniref:Membrane protein n=1 Tax=Mycolicibacterium duvalii TaxID=39688 RepID=A0A7I7K5A3_9MYCO|nr:DUF456 domain-containing protein [Mycolicibacterium duvalii]MCV7368795.1 DUF456 domain-containing protein [Mycolicibacterium duvalii]PEG44303.1 hypothetical protein CRI77_00055 [Mycolicibacterium duvalii]BBX19310.1 membrane protein [Mycolicibacterium duvalii]